MLTTCNPGSFLEVRGSFELGASLVEREDAPILSAAAAHIVRDRESGAEISLAQMLRSFMYDPDEKVTGPLRITISPLR